jgi:hypothetical protein
MDYTNDPSAGHMRMFNSLVGYEYDFYGIDNHAFCIGIDGKRMAFEALEDEGDGYRSYFDSFRIAMDGNIFFNTPIARVKLEDFEVDTDDNVFSGWRLVDVVDQHVWLLVGTDHCDNYYPYFTFDYTPKKALP